MSARRIRSKLVRLTPEEFAEIERRALAAGELPARYLRNAALTGVAAPAPSDTASSELLHTLGAIGADLKALVRSAADPGIRTRAEGVLGEVVAILRHLTIDRHEP